MLIYLMLLVFFDAHGGHVMARPFDTLAACEAAKPAAIAQAEALNITDLGITCATVQVGKGS